MPGEGGPGATGVIGDFEASLVARSSHCISLVSWSMPGEYAFSMAGRSGGTLLESERPRERWSRCESRLRSGVGGGEGSRVRAGEPLGDLRKSERLGEASLGSASWSLK